MDFQEAHGHSKRMNHTFRAFSKMEEVLEAAASAEQSLGGLRDSVKAARLELDTILVDTSEAKTEHEALVKECREKLQKKLNEAEEKLHGAELDSENKIKAFNDKVKKAEKEHEQKLTAFDEEVSQRVAEKDRMHTEIQQLTKRLSDLRNSAYNAGQALEEVS